MNDTPLPQQLKQMDAARLRRYAEHLAFYGGEQWPPMTRRQQRRLVFNYAKAIIDKTASYLMTGMHVAVDPDGDSPEAAARARDAERALARVYDENALDQLDFDTEIDASILGDGAYKITWDDDHRRVRVTAPDVQGLFAWWHADDVSRIWRVCSRYAIDAGSAHALYNIKPSRAERASVGQPSPAINVGHAANRNGPQAPSPRVAQPPSAVNSRNNAVEIIESWTDTTFELWAAGTRIDQRDNPYGFIPFVIFPNLREPKQFWGLSDIPAIREPVRELNRALSQLSMILELSGNPIAVLENVTESTDIAVMPGAVWELPERAKAYLLDLLQGGGVKLHADYVDLVYRALHDLGESPRTAFGENRAGLSGVALNVELDPLLKKVARKRLIRGAAYRRRNEMILRILERFAYVAHVAQPSQTRRGEPSAVSNVGQATQPAGVGQPSLEESPGRPAVNRNGPQAPSPAYAPYRSRIVWGSVLPLDRSRLVEDERALVAAGIHSRRRAADELGVEDPELEFRRWLEEREMAGGP